jgi:transcriptional regulator with XRE-family HTH domain
MITPAQSRMARGALSISMKELSELSGISLATIHKYETAKVISNLATVDTLQRAFERAGVEFISGEGGRGEGVRLRRPSRPGMSSKAA